jgi:YihY family inner membrane protein
VPVVGRPDRFQRRHAWLGFPLAVLYKFFDDFGSYLAATLTYYACVSLFPLLLIASTVLGVVLSGDQALQHQLLTSALRSFPVIGSELDDPKRLSGGPAGLIIGILGSVYGALGVAQAFQYASNQMWAVPRNSRPNPLKARGRSLVLLAIMGTGILAATVLSIVSAGGVGAVGTTEKYLAVALSVLINIALSIFAFRFAPARRLSVRDVLPGAIGAAVSWQLLQSFGVIYVQHVVGHASETNAVFAVVLGLLAYLYLTALTLLFCVEINVVRVNHMHPRALLTPFTDNVDLTAGDRRTYTRLAKAQRNKGFEHIDVDFSPPEDPAEPDQAGSAGATEQPARERPATEQPAVGQPGAGDPGDASDGAGESRHA